MPAALVAVSLIARAVPVSGLAHLVLAVGAPYLAVASLISLAVVLWRRRTVAVLAAVLLAVAAVGVQVSWYWLGRAPTVGEHVEVRVLMANINRGQVDAAQFVEAASSNADIVTVAELTPEAVRRITAAGIGRDFPHAHLIPGPEAEGIGIWSRYPLTALWERPGADFVIAARARVPGVRVPPVIASMHIFSPVADGSNNVDRWRSDLVSAGSRLDDLAAAAGQGSVIVGGDFNSTPDVKQFRDLLTDGYRDAVEQSGSGFAPTFPADAWFPPLITIDHVLTRGAVATSAPTIGVAGTDHRLVAATVEVPTGQYAPLWLSTARAVLSAISKSATIDQFST